MTVPAGRGCLRAWVVVSGLAGRSWAEPDQFWIDSTIRHWCALAMTFGLSMDYEIFLLTRDPSGSCSPATPVTPSRTGVSTSARHHQRGADHDRGVHRIRVRFTAALLVAQLAACAVE